MMGETLVELGIREWIAGLEALDPDDDFAAHVTEYVQTHRVEPESLAPYTFFEERHYTRNLVFRSDLFDVLALCWEPGQVSAIHNHRDQQCWMVMGSGRLENMNYRVVARDEAKGTCALEPSTTLLITREQPMAVDPVEPVHRVVNCPSHGKRAVSVHVYSRPFDVCEVYDLQQGTYKDIQLTFYSRFGERVR